MHVVNCCHYITLLWTAVFKYNCDGHNCETSYVISNIIVLRLNRVVQFSLYSLPMQCFTALCEYIRCYLFICLLIEIQILSVFEIIPSTAVNFSVPISWWAHIRASLGHTLSSRITVS